MHYLIDLQSTTMMCVCVCVCVVVVVVVVVVVANPGTEQGQA